MKEVIWVFGASASGKQTFIRNVLSSKDLAGKLGWSNKKIAACEDSLRLLGNIGDEPVVAARRDLVNKIASLSQLADIVLIKWQYIDSELKTPQKLLALLPEYRHRIILLKTTSKEIKSRLKIKDWWKDTWDTTDFTDKEPAMVQKCIDDLGASFSVLTLDSSNNKNYQKL